MKNNNNHYKELTELNQSVFLKCGIVCLSGKKFLSHILGITSLLILLFINISYSQNINKPNITGPGGLKVNSFSGGLYLERSDLFIPCHGIPINLTFYYNSVATGLDFGYGSGWSMNYSMTYKKSGSSVIIRWGDGRKDIFTSVNGGFSAPLGIFDTLIQIQPGKFELRTKNGVKYSFEDTTHKRLTKISDPNNNILSINYTGSLATSITDPSGRAIQLNYTNGHLTEITDPNTNPARRIIFVNDEKGNPLSVRDPLGNTISYTYDSYRNIKKVVGKGSNQFSITYSNFQNVSKITSSLNSIDISYDTTLRKTTVRETVDGVLKSNSYLFDTTGNLSQSINNCCGYNDLYKYDSQKNIIQKTDANGNIYSYTYDSRGNRLTETDPLGGIIRYTYEPIFNKVSSMTDKQGNITNYSYNSTGNLTQILKPLNISEIKTYDSYGNLISDKDGKGNTTTYEYNLCGDRTKVTFADGVTNIYTYNNIGDKTSFRDGNGFTTTYTYDLMGRLKRTTNPAGKSTSNVYDSRGNLISTTDIFSSTTTYGYDGLSRKISMTTPSGTSRFTYDEKGNVITKTDNNGFVTRYTYNTQNLVQNETNPLGRTRSFQYDANGNKQSETDFNGNTISYVYDKFNRVIKKIQPASNTIEYTYDANNNLTSIKDPKNQTTSYIYDALNRKTRETFANGTAKNYLYDNANNLISSIPPDGFRTNLYYDSRNRLITRNFTGGNDAFTYDNEGKIISAVNNNASVTYTYNNIGWVLSENLNGKSTNYSYYIPTKKRIITYPGNRVVTEEYDNSHRLKSVKAGGITVNYFYDAGDRVTTRSSIGAYSEVSLYTYNQNNWITNINHLCIDTIASFSYAYDNNGNRLYEKKNHHLTNSEQYTYDANNQLTNFKSGILVGSEIQSPNTQTQFNFDLAGNRSSIIQDNVTTTYTVNNVNAYSSLTKGTAVTTPTYHSDGNLLYDGTYNYTYGKDIETHLKSVTSGATTIASYNYDALGRRIQKVTPQATINYYYDGDRIIEERNGSDVIQASYIYGRGIDEVLNMKRGSKTYFYFENALGSIAAVTNTTNLVMERYEYDFNGKPIIYDNTYNVRTATAIKNGYMFTGREYDAETGNYYYRTRFYKTNWGRFGQIDMIGNWGDGNNNGNGYTYVGNNPVNYTDPFGLKLVNFRKNSKGTVSADCQCSMTIISFGGLTISTPILIGTYELDPGGRGDVLWDAIVSCRAACSVRGYSHGTLIETQPNYPSIYRRNRSDLSWISDGSSVNPKTSNQPSYPSVYTRTNNYYSWIQTR